MLQGSPVSPYLFNFLVDGLITKLNLDVPPKEAIPYTVLYTDDGTLLLEDYNRA